MTGQRTSVISATPKSICILRLSAIGDVCHTVPVVLAIKKHWPHTQLSWVIGATEAALVDDIPGIEFITVSKSRGRAGWKQLRAALKSRRFDVLLHMQYALRASGYSMAIRARKKVGFDRQRARDLQWLFSNEKITHQSSEHVMDALFGFARWLGVPTGEPEWNIPIPDKAIHYAASVCPADRAFAIVSPAASNPARNWIAQRYAEVADYIVNHHGLAVVLTASPDTAEVALCQAIEKIMTVPVLNLAGKTSLKQLFALISRARFILAPDAGPVHMATAAGVRVVALYAASNPQRTGPYRHRNLVVNHYPQELAKATGRTIDEVRWGRRVPGREPMSGITVGEVCEKVDLALGANGGS